MYFTVVLLAVTETYMMVLKEHKLFFCSPFQERVMVLQAGNVDHLKIIINEATFKHTKIVLICNAPPYNDKNLSFSDQESLDYPNFHLQQVLSSDNDKVAFLIIPTFELNLRANQVTS